VSPQLSLVYDPSHVGGEVWEKQRSILRQAVDLLSAKEVSFALNVSGSMLADALDERDRKRVAAKWLCVIVAMLVKRGDDTARSLVRQLFDAALEPTPFAVEENDELTDEEIVARLKRDDAGRAAIARVTKGARR
jgi:hypothetical protein